MNEKVIGTIITDCSDVNAMARQCTRFANLFGVQPTFVGVDPLNHEISAAGNLVDQLDVASDVPVSHLARQTVILVNVAPRGDHVRDPKYNGTPFGRITVGNTLIVSTFGQCLSLVRDMGIVEKIDLFDVPSVTAAAVEWGELSQTRADRINRTQFRSLEFLPLVAHWLINDRPVPVAETRSLAKVGSAINLGWNRDNFGNIKTTLLPKDIDFQEGKPVELVDGKVAYCHAQLAHVPKGESALVVGSSGYGNERFLEVVVQRGSAAERHGLDVGSPILMLP